MKHIERIFACFPAEIRQEIQSVASCNHRKLQEIRVYKDKEVHLFADNKHIQLRGRIKGDTITQILNNLMKYSYYAYEEDIAKGFITIDGGHRVGICGKAVMNQGRVTMLREVSSFNIRWAREVIGCSDSLMQYIITPEKINNVLIVSPPGCGKTTLLRDIARNLSQRDYKVAICDERSEIAGMHGGITNYQFGHMVDVLDGCPKAEGIIMLIRSMSPDIIIADEIGRPEDLQAIETCVHAGVSVITSAHGYSIEDIHDQYFDKLIFLTDSPHPGCLREVINV